MKRYKNLLSFVALFFTEYAFLLLILWLVVLGSLYVTLSVLRHMHFQSGAFDLGIFDQAVWQYSHGIIPYNTIKERLIIGDHLNLILPLLSPLYYIWSDVRSLLIFQAIWITASSIAVYKLILRRNFSPFVALCLSSVYSLFYGIQFADYFDFHPVVIGVGLLAWFLYFYEAKKWKWMWLSLIFIFLTQENMGIAVAGIGIIYLFKENHRRSALLFMCGGVVLSLLSVKLVSLFSPVGYQYSPAVTLNPINLLKQLFDSQDKRLVWLYTFSWFSFFPLFSPGALGAVLLDLSQYFLPTKQFGHMVSPFLHHRAILSSFTLLGTLDVLGFIQTKRKVLIPFVVLFLLLSSLSQQFIFHFPINKLTKKDYWKNESWMRDNQELFATIPREASVAASQNLVPHLSQRKEIYLLWPRKHTEKHNPCGEKECWWLDFAGKPEYLVVDLHQGQWITQLLESNDNFSHAIANMESKRKIMLIRKYNDARLYKVM
jgi:uncharacterized membrane protein